MNDFSADISCRFSKTAIPMEASKWLKIQVLADEEEMASLLDRLPDFRIFTIGRVVETGGELVSREVFLKEFTQYLGELKSGRTPDEIHFRKAFSTVFTTADDHLVSMKVSDNKHLLKVVRPCVQLQLHCFGYSPLDGKFRPMVFGKGSIHWGIQFSFPQLFKNQESQQIELVRNEVDFPNISLFKSLQKWTRVNTTPTPFMIEGRKENVPIRLGKGCFQWINRHPQLVQKNLKVSGEANDY